MKWYKNLCEKRRKLSWIAKNYDSNQNYLLKRIAEAEKIIKDRTIINVDAQMSERSPHQIIVMGKYKGNDYVQAFHVYEDINALVERLKEMERYGTVNRMDAPYSMRAYLEGILKSK